MQTNTNLINAISLGEPRSFVDPYIEGLCQNHSNQFIANTRTLYQALHRGGKISHPFYAFSQKTWFAIGAVATITISAVDLAPVTRYLAVGASILFAFSASRFSPAVVERTRPNLDAFKGIIEQAHQQTLDIFLSQLKEKDRQDIENRFVSAFAKALNNMLNNSQSSSDTDSGFNDYEYLMIKLFNEVQSERNCALELDFTVLDYLGRQKQSRLALGDDQTKILSLMARRDQTTIAEEKSKIDHYLNRLLPTLTAKRKREINVVVLLKFLQHLCSHLADTNSLNAHRTNDQLVDWNNEIQWLSKYFQQQTGLNTSLYRIHKGLDRISSLYLVVKNAVLMELSVAEQTVWQKLLLLSRHIDTARIQKMKTALVTDQDVENIRHIMCNIYREVHHIFVSPTYNNIVSTKGELEQFEQYLQVIFNWAKKIREHPLQINTLEKEQSTLQSIHEFITSKIANKSIKWAHKELAQLKSLLTLVQEMAERLAIKETVGKKLLTLFNDTQQNLDIILKPLNQWLANPAKYQTQFDVLKQLHAEVTLLTRLVTNAKKHNLHIAEDPLETIVKRETVLEGLIGKKWDWKRAGYPRNEWESIALLLKELYHAIAHHGRLRDEVTVLLQCTPFA